MREDSTYPGGLLKRVAAVAAGMVLLALGFMFSLVILAVVAVAGLAAWGWFWWKTHELRQAMRERSPMGMDGHRVIEGEAVIVEEYRAEREVLPREPLP